MQRDERSGNAGDLSRRAILLASSVPEPQVERSIRALPSLIAEAGQRRLIAASLDARILAAGRFWIPRLAPATALLVTAALLWSGGSIRRQTTAGPQSTSLDRWLMTGAAPEHDSDPVVNALICTPAKDRPR